jgi:hypothetical protein
MNTSSFSAHPLFDPRSLYTVLRTSGPEALRMRGYLHLLRFRSERKRAALALEQAHWFAADGPRNDPPSEPLEALVFLCPRDGSPDEGPAFCGSFEARLALVSKKEGAFVGLPWGPVECQALEAALGGAVSELLPAQALLVEPEVLDHLGQALGVSPTEPQLGSRNDLLRRALAARALTDNPLVAHLLAAVPHFEGEIDSGGSARFPWYPAPPGFDRFPPRPVPLALALVVQAGGPHKGGITG